MSCCYLQSSFLKVDLLVTIMKHSPYLVLIFRLQTKQKSKNDDEKLIFFLIAISFIEKKLKNGTTFTDTITTPISNTKCF